MHTYPRERKRETRGERAAMRFSSSACSSSSSSSSGSSEASISACKRSKNASEKSEKRVLSFPRVSLSTVLTARAFGRFFSSFFPRETPRARVEERDLFESRRSLYKVQKEEEKREHYLLSFKPEFHSVAPRASVAERRQRRVRATVPAKDRKIREKETNPHRNKSARAVGARCATSLLAEERLLRGSGASSPAGSPRPRLLSSGRVWKRFVSRSFPVRFETRDPSVRWSTVKATFLNTRKDRPNARTRLDTVSRENPTQLSQRNFRRVSRPRAQRRAARSRTRPPRPPPPACGGGEISVFFKYAFIFFLEFN